MPTAPFDQSASQLVRRAISSKYPLIYLVSAEEKRIEDTLKLVSEEHYQDQRNVVTWTASRGFDSTVANGVDLTDPVNALNHIASQQQDVIYLMKDLPGFFERDHRIERVLRDLYAQLADKNSFVIMSYPLLQLPVVLKKEIYVVELDLPTEQDIITYLAPLLESQGMTSSSADRVIARCAKGLRGLSFNEIRHLFLRIFETEKLTLDSVVKEVFEEKSQVLKKETCLEPIADNFHIDDIGGLENLKKWVEVRGNLFSSEASSVGVQPPSGVLFMGVSGCGKSLAAKAIASAWKLPLVRLDMGLVMSGVFGSPEYAFDRAIRTVENIAPLVLWIDEVENSFGYDEGPGTSSNVNIFSTFLTWMQEKPADVFVAATANRIQKLPAEMIRKGRFDQVFYVDLPRRDERREIFVIHLDAVGKNISDDELDNLAAMTEGWSGSEIEQSVNSSRIDAYNEDRDCCYRDVLINVGKNVPLSQTMKEQVQALRNWSIGRTTPASSTSITRKVARRGARAERREKGVSV